MRLISALALTLAVSPAVRAQQAERYTLEGDEAAVYNLVGDLRVEAGQGAVTVQVTRGGAAAAQLKVAHGDLDGRDALRVIYPSDRIAYAGLEHGSSTHLRVRDDGTFGDAEEWGRHHRDWDDDGHRVTISGAGAGLDAHADLLVRVPPGSRVSLNLAVGRVTITNVQAELAVDAHDAPVSSTGTRGALSIDVGSGAVQVTQAEGELSVDTGSGRVELTRCKGSRLSVDTGSGDVTGSDLQATEIDIDTGSGEVRLAGIAAPRLTQETGSGSVSADLHADVSELSVETGSGDVTVKAPPSLGAGIEIETSGGDIETDLPLQVTRQSRDHVVGQVGDGRGRIAIETGSGGIKLLKGGS